jgi:hypothetical protein
MRKCEVKRNHVPRRLPENRGSAQRSNAEITRHSHRTKRNALGEASRRSSRANHR